MENKNIDLQIDRYLLGEMTLEEELAFEKLIKEDSTLREKVRLTNFIIKAFKYEGEQDVIEEMKSMSKEDFKKLIYSIDPPKKAVKRTLRPRIYAAVTAVAAVALILLYIGTRPQFSSGDLYSQYYFTQAYETSSSRGDSELTIEQMIQLRDARHFYEEGKYPEALAIYNQFIQESADWKLLPEEVILYAAICRFETGDNTDAVEKLSYLASSDQFEFQDEALWNLAFVYLKDNQRSKAKSNLRQLIDKDSHYAEKATEVLESLNRRKWFN